MAVSQNLLSSWHACTRGPSEAPPPSTRPDRRNKCRLYAPIIVHIVQYCCTTSWPHSGGGLDNHPAQLSVGTYLTGKFQQFAIANNVIVMCNRHNLLSFLDVFALLLTAWQRGSAATATRWRRGDPGRDIKECMEIGVCAWPMNNCWIFRIILVTLSRSIIIIIISASSTTHWQDDGQGMEWRHLALLSITQPTYRDGLDRQDVSTSALAVLIYTLLCRKHQMVDLMKRLTQSGALCATRYLLVQMSSESDWLFLFRNLVCRL